MASEYSLKLKATLDTTEVKQKLDKLRQMQKQQLGENSGNRYGSQENCNSQNLASTMDRLNRTISSLHNQLQNTLDKFLNNYKNDVMNKRGGIPLIPLNISKKNDITDNGIKVHKKQNNTKEFIEALQKYQKSNTPINRDFRFISEIFKKEMYKTYNPKVRKMLDPIMSEISSNLPKHKMIIDNNDIYRRMTDDEIRKKYAYEATRKAYFKPFTSKSGKNLSEYINESGFYDKRSIIRDPNLRSTLKWGTGLATHQVMGGIGQYFDETGNKAGSVAMGIGQYAVMGGAIGGPVGAGIGLVAGTLSEAFKELTERARNLSEALSQQEQRVNETKTIDRTLQRKIQDENDSRRLKVGDIGYFKSRLQKKQDILDLLNRQQEEIGTEAGSLTRYEKETQTRIEAFKASSPRGTLPESIRRRQRIADRYKVNIQTIEQVKSDITGYQNSLESLGVLSDKKQEQKDFNESVPRNETWRLTAMRDIWEKDLQEAEARKSRLYYRSEKTGTPASIEALESIQEEIDTFKERLGTLNEELNKRYEQKRENDRVAIGEDIDRLQEALNNATAPDMTAVTSLASQGYMTLGKDENLLDQQIDYLKQQLDIQRAIKDKMRQQAEFE